MKRKREDYEFSDDEEDVTLDKNYDPKKRKTIYMHDYEEEDEGEYDDSDDDELLEEENTTSGEEDLMAETKEDPVFRRGKIKRVKLKDFMVFEKVTFHPGPGLNLICAPNGSGKSSLVSALCLGLAGKTNVLDRGDTLSEFIRIGAEEAKIEIELFQDEPKENIVIERIIRRNSSSYKIDGDPASSETVENLVKKMNIQFDNLISFVPQERVSKFAELDEVQRLDLLQRNLLTEEERNYQVRLIDLQSTTSDSLDKLLSVENKYNSEIRKNEALKREVDRYFKRMEYIKTCDILAVKIKLLEFNEKLRLMKQAKDECNRTIGDIREFEKKELPLKKQINEAKEKKIESAKKFIAAKNSAKNEKRKIQNKKRDVERISKASEKFANKLSSIENRAKENAKNIKKQKKLIQNVEKILNDLPKVEVLNDEVKKWRLEMKEFEDKHDELLEERERLDEKKTEISEALYGDKRNVEKLKDMKRIKIRKVKEYNPTAFSVYEWVNRNRKLFRGEVYFVPMEIETKISKFAYIFEHHIPNYVMSSFVVTEEADRNLIRDEFVEKRKKKVSVIRGRHKDYQNPIPLIQLKERYNVVTYLDKVVESKPIVMSTLVNLASINKVVIGTKKEKILDGIFKECHKHIQVAYTPDRMFKLVKSRYERKHSTSMSTLKYTKSRVLFQYDKKKIEEVQKRIEVNTKRLEDIKEKIAKVRKKEGEFYKRKERLNDKCRKNRKMGKKVKAQQRKLRNLASKLSDLEEVNFVEEKESILKKLRRNNKKRVDIEEEMLGLWKKFVPTQDVLIVSKLRENKYRKEHEDLLRQQERERGRLKELRAEVIKYKKKYSLSKREAKDFRKIYFEEKEKLGNTYKDLSDPETYNMVMIKYSKDIVTVKTKLDHQRRLADSSSGSRKSVDEYERRIEKIEELKKELDGLKDNRRKVEKEMKDLEKKWFSPLRRKIKIIHKTFMEYCKEIRISGEIELNVNREDYSQCGLDIRVKFREKEKKLSSLSGARQSGGEKNVTTMLFIMSLFKFSSNPFIVIDEINQGMDERNERKVFNFLLRQSKGRNKPQIFVITPKLIPLVLPIEYISSREPSVFVVMNGFGLSDKEVKEFKRNVTITKL